jgi:hypothetical protein
VPGERETGFRLFTDPVGHPFYIVFGQHSTYSTSSGHAAELAPVGE